MLSAETSYLFRHALLRDAAYELQVPSDRAELHRLAFYIIEKAFGGRPPEPPALDAIHPPHMRPHPCDKVAKELADHAQLAQPQNSTGTLGELGRLYLQRAALSAERHFRNEEALGLWQRLAAQLSGDARAAALRRAGLVSMSADLGSVAKPLLEEALAEYRASGNLRCEGITRTNLATLYAITGQRELAEQNFMQSLQTHRDVGDHDAEGVALGNLALLYQQNGQFEQAEQHFQQALIVDRETGNRRGEGIALANLAVTQQIAGRSDLAEPNFQQALSILHTLDNPRFEGNAMGNLAILYRETGRLEQAEQTIRQAIAIHRRVGNRLFEGTHLCEYGMCLLVRKRANARDIWREGAAILHELGRLALLERHTTEIRQVCAEAGIEPFDT